MDRRKKALQALPKPLTANEELQRAIVRHAVRLERVKSNQVRRVQSFLDEFLYPDLLALTTSRLERIKARGFDRGPQRTRRVVELTNAIEGLVSEKMKEARGIVKDGLYELSTTEATWQSGALKTVAPISFEVLLPAKETLRSIVTSRPFRGRLLRDWYKGIDVGLRQKAKSAISIGIAEGEGTAAITRRLRDVVGGTRRGVEAITRTAVNHVTANARQESYKANEDIIKGWVYSATLDSRTTYICSGLDGQEFPLNSGPKPPQHIGCRSVDLPLLKSWKELGFDAKDTPLATRIKYDGKVPGTFTFGEFLNGESPKFQREYLGKTRYELWKTGRVKIDGFTDKRGHTLTIEQLRLREPEAFKAAAGLREASSKLSLAR